MNVTVKKDGEDVTFLYSTEQINTRQGLVFHNWINENHKGQEGEPFVFIGGEAIDKEHPERMEKYRLQAEGIIKSKLGIVDVVPTPAEETKPEEVKVEEVIEPKSEDTTPEEGSGPIALCSLIAYFSSWRSISFFVFNFNLLIPIHYKYTHFPSYLMYISYISIKYHRQLFMAFFHIK
jgi:hypothetical protein